MTEALIPAPSQISLTRDEVRRYSRHLIIPDIGVNGQQRLKDARVLCIGAGGLGSPALLYLAAAGVGTIGIIDGDHVDESNLQRQIIHGTSDVGRPKVESAAEAVAEINPHVRVTQYREMLTHDNALEIFGDHDLIVDGTDNFTTRYLINDAAVLAGKPYVWGRSTDSTARPVCLARPRGRVIDAFIQLRPRPDWCRRALKAVYSVPSAPRLRRSR